MRQSPTAAAVYHADIVPTLPTRQKLVVGHLAHYRAKYGTPPTALELLRLMNSFRVGQRMLDVNGVRPRLNELAAMGVVTHGPKRRCTVSGKTVLTWELPTTCARRLF